MGVRLTPAGRGLPVKVLTAFVKGHPFAAFIRADLRGRGMDVEGPEVPQSGPWGYRHQINIADSGAGLRGPRVWNDRAGEVGRTLRAEDFDLDRIFGDEGVEMIHLSGLIAALAPSFSLTLAETAMQYGARISFDLNYRASFWEGREAELRDTFKAIASLSDILIGNEEDFQLCLGIEGPAAGGKDLAGKTDAFRAMIGDIRRQYPRAKVVATTFKVGGGDGFVGGLLYGLLKNWDIEKCAQFGWACGVLAVTLETDYARPADEEQIWSIWNGNARVKR